MNKVSPLAVLAVLVVGGLALVDKVAGEAVITLIGGLLLSPTRDPEE